MAQKKRKRSRKARRVENKKPQFTGWLSNDSEEILRRRLRAEEERFRIETISAGAALSPYFATFAVHTANESSYVVEIIALNQHRNNCNCPDRQINGLGTCKHIEAVLLKLRKMGIRKFQQAASAGSSRIEIYLRQQDEQEQVAIQWPAQLAAKAAARRLLAPFFANDGSLLAEPIDALPALQRAVAEAHPQVQRKIRISQHLSPWLQARRYDHERQQAHSAFLQDIKQGKRSVDILKAPLYPYQQTGMQHLAFKERALLADEMGLGKTVQAIAACELLRRLRGIQRVLVIAPASLKTEWEEQIAQFTDLPAQIILGSRTTRLQQYKQTAFFYLANYEQIRVDVQVLQETLAPDVIILDEAQRIKNWQTKTAAAVKRLHSRYAFVLTGTPLENRIDEIYSIVQFLDPKIFGPLFRFNRDFYQLDERGRPIGYKSLDELHRRLQPIMLRRRKHDVEGELPDRTVNNFYVQMHPEQNTRYDEYSAEVAKLTAIAQRRPLKPEEFERLQKFLACMRMVCDTPYILDPECRIAPKLHELESVLYDVLEEYDNKVLIFSEWTRMLELVAELAQTMNLDFALHTGSVAQPKRRAEINRFKSDPDCRLFLSSDSGSTGLNLQAANVVINMDLPWNPARLEQRIGRAWRKHQTRSVQVVNFISENTIEHRMLHMLDLKRTLADSVVDGSTDISEMELPSGRQAFVERLQNLMGHTAPGTSTNNGTMVGELPADLTNSELAGVPNGAPTGETNGETIAVHNPLESLKQDTVARLNDRLDQLQVYGHNGNQTVLAVVDKIDDMATTVIEQAVDKQTPAAQLELLDRATFAAIQRLIDAGVLQLNEQHAQRLHQVDTDNQRQGHAQRQRWLQEARQQLAAAERKRRMAGVLASGGFPIESLIPLRDAIEMTVAALTHSLGESRHNSESQAIPLKFIESRLLQAQLLPNDAPTLIARLRSEEDADADSATDLYQSGSQLLDFATQALDQAVLTS